MELNRRLTHAIRIQRKHLKLTLRDVSEKTGLAISFINDLEHGRKKLNVLTLEKLEKVLKIYIHIELGE